MARRSPVTIAVLTLGDKKTTRAFLHGLGKITNRKDNVLLIEQAAIGARRAWYAKDAKGEFHRSDRTRNARPETPRSIVVFVDERVLGFGRWIDRLVELLDDDQVGAVSPRSNVGDGEELLVGVPYRPYEPELRTEYLKAHSGRNPLAPSEVGRLRGPCIATTLEILGDQSGFDDSVANFDPAEVVAAARTKRRRVLVAEDVYLHHPGGQQLTTDPRRVGYPMLSACLIVKDEEHNIDQCLSSIAELVDEIVIYDTGSTDSTLEIASRHNPIIIRGHWDDDFARARNDALSHCSGQWILWIDADEALECRDHDALRALLRSSSSDVEGITILIDNLRGNTASTSLTHPACRIFRRSVGHWQGTVHEQIVARDGNETMAIATAPMLSDIVRIKHWGYLQSELIGKHKGERNVRTAFGDLAGRSDLGIAERVLSLGRSHLLVGKVSSGIDLCRLAAMLTTYPPTLRFALRGTIEGLIAAGRFDEALALIEPLKLADADKLAHSLAAAIHLAAGRPGAVLLALDEIDDGLDVDGFEYSANFLAGTRATALAALERHDEAAEVLLKCLRDKGGVDAHLGLLIECVERAEGDLGAIYEAIGADRIIEFAPQLLQIRPDAADRCLDAWFDRATDTKVILAMGSSIAVRLDLDRRAHWSHRVREAGFAAGCPLIAAAASPRLQIGDRRESAELAASKFFDARGSLLHRALSHDSQVLPINEASRWEDKERRHVLVIARDVSGIDAVAVACVLRRAGNDVTLIHPRPTDESFELLNPLQIGVHGWTETPSTAWQRSCLNVIACIYAARPIDAVMLCAGTKGLRDELRKRLVAAEITTDSELRIGASVADIYLNQDVPHVDSRLGISVAANLRTADPASVEFFNSTIAPLITLRLSDFPMVVMGDDPGESLKRVLPLAVHLGPQVDPTRWVRSTKVLLIPFEHDARRFSEVAAHCGTPALVLPKDLQDAELFVRATIALLSSEQVWRANAPKELPTRHGPGTDPLGLRSTEPAVGRQGRRSELWNREIVLKGDVRSHSSLARVNRELSARLNRDRRFSFKVCEQSPLEEGNDTASRLLVEHIEFSDGDVDAAIEIRHQWPPDFTPARGRLVLILPWEFGSYPAEWVGPIRDAADEVWVPTTWVREGAISAGVDPRKVQVVPNGVDTDVYRPDGPVRQLKTKANTRFLFVGGLIDRKGIDVLLEVYLSNFTKSDDVCLVVKPFGSGSFYNTEMIDSTLRQAATADGPKIEIIDEDLDEESMAALYRSCTALVHPYRGEGFGLPIAEAMGCGLPGIVTNGGACLDYCDPSTSWLIDAQRVPMIVEHMTPSEGGSWWLEPSRLGLAQAMKSVIERPFEVRRFSEAGRERIATHFTWDSAAAIAASRIAHLLGDVEYPHTTPMPTSTVQSGGHAEGLQTTAAAKGGRR